jgi:hypothetical protein
MFWKPIISMYWTFNSRKIIYENVFTKKRREEHVWRAFSSPFPKSTDSVDSKTYDHILNGGSYMRLGETLILKKELLESNQ